MGSYSYKEKSRSIPLSCAILSSPPHAPGEVLGLGRSPVAEAKCTGAQLAGPHTAGVASLNLLFFHRVSLDLTEAFFWKVLHGVGQFSKLCHPVTITTSNSCWDGKVEGKEGAFFFIPSGPSISNFAVHYLTEFKQKDQRTSVGLFCKVEISGGRRSGY